jgi:nitroimidazol reductase NimA-like FMN-containing flavoprotein (pyridoxamine 5'-phosphate oxidase superfamily)
METDGLEVLEETDAWALLREAPIGRVCIRGEVITVPFPVTFVVVGDEILFMSAEGSKTSAAANDALVSFEVDGFDVSTRSGWSVVVSGVLRVVSDPKRRRAAAAAGLSPWVSGAGPLQLLAITPAFLTGRRILGTSTRGDQS